MMKILLLVVSLLTTALTIQAQTAQDTLDIKRVALAYLESQHTPNPKLMEGALHPRIVKRSVFKNKKTKKDYVSEYSAENLVILAETYNINGDKFPKDPKKEVKLLDVSALTASVKLIANEWFDYMHIVKTNGEWKIINVLWQYNNVSEHQ
jgi:Putative lumazine-binding